MRVDNIKRNLTKYSNHINLFKINREDSYLKIFEKFITTSSEGILECSCKLESENIYPWRFNLWFTKWNISKNIESWLNFIKEIIRCWAKLNISLLKNLFEWEFEYNLLESCIIWIDIREAFSESRCKFWLTINRWNYKLFNKIINLHGYNKDIEDVILTNKLLFWFDFYFDWRSKIKIYPSVTNESINNILIAKRFWKHYSQKTIRIMQESHITHLSYTGIEFEKIIHLNPYDIELMLEKIWSDKLKDITNKIKNIAYLNWKPSNYIIWLFESEISQNNIKNFNVYYY